MAGEKLTIINLGPIAKCEIELGKFNVLTGKQSSGKSTVAKSLYFFLKLKDVLGRLAFECHHPGILADGKGDSLNKKFKYALRDMFEDIFDINSISSNKETVVRMDYTDGIYVQIAINKLVAVTYSNKLRDFVRFLEQLEGDSLEKTFNDSLQIRIDEFFHMDYSPVYIPAGRGFMTVLGSQFDVFYSTSNDENKSMMDLCTRDYIETIMRLRPLYGKNLSGLWKRQRWEDALKKAYPYMHSVLNGEYYYLQGEEYIEINEDQSIKVNRASSGQQEALWIYNVLLYNMICSTKKFYIIEEPESNLFPESQQNITKFLGLIFNSGNPMLINTHSPYVLGELNNMVYAGTIPSGRKKTFEVIAKDCQLRFDDLRAFFVEDGMVDDCLDREIKQINSTKLDEISNVINDEFDRLLKIERGQ